jgi:hypothetical protein
VGNATTDIPVWRHARRAIVVNAPAALALKAGGICEVEKVFPRLPTSLSTSGRVLRVHRWLKNLLLFIPMLAAHEFGNCKAPVGLMQQEK